MNFVSRMTALLADMRRERNGAVADAMAVCGRPCGLNLGVSIPTIRRIAAGETPEMEFAECLYRQDVRELKIAALCLAEPHRLTPENLDFWIDGIVNSEIAEQAAMLLFGRSGCVTVLLDKSSATDDPLICYSAMMSAARNAECDVDNVLKAIAEALRRFPDNGLAARGAVAAAVSASSREPERVKKFVSSLCGNSPAVRYFVEETLWQIA